VPLELLAGRLATVTAALTTDSGGPPVDAVLPDGVDLEVFHPGAKDDRPTVLFVGTWEGRKRGRQLFEWFTSEVLDRVPDAELVMVSDECPPHPQVRHVPAPSDGELAALVRGAWVQAVPSTYEGFGLPALEALASGTAVVATPNPGSRHVLEEGRWGRLVDDEGFADALVDLLGDRSAREELAAAGLVRAAGCSWANVADQHRAVYRSVVTG
jgi:glycosyltransferase involved in cell wall biosynthesis